MIMKGVSSNSEEKREKKRSCSLVPGGKGEKKRSTGREKKRRSFVTEGGILKGKRSHSVGEKMTSLVREVRRKRAVTVTPGGTRKKLNVSIPSSRSSRKQGENLTEYLLSSIN